MMTTLTHCQNLRAHLQSIVLQENQKLFVDHLHVGTEQIHNLTRGDIRENGFNI